MLYIYRLSYYIYEDGSSSSECIVLFAFASYPPSMPRLLGRGAAKVLSFHSRYQEGSGDDISQALTQ